MGGGNASIPRGWVIPVLQCSFGHSILRRTFVSGERGAEMGGRAAAEVIGESVTVAHIVC